MGNVIYATEQDANRHLDMQDALAAVEQAFRATAAGQAAVAPRSRCSLGVLNLNLLGGSLAEPEAVGAKVYVTGGGKAKFWGMLFDSQGTLKMLYEADRLGQLRTGAASGLSARLLARTQSSRLAMVGSGYQARTQVAGILATTGISEVMVYSRTAQHAAHFAAEISRVHGVSASTVASVDEAVTVADVVVTMTSASEPLVLAEHVRPGVHYVFAGSNNPRNAEAAPEALARMDLVTTDHVDQAKAESGTLRRAVEAGAISWDVPVSLDRVLSGEVAGRTSATQATAFVSHGLGLWDTALATILYERVVSSGEPAELALDGAPEEGRR